VLGYDPLVTCVADETGVKVQLLVLPKVNLVYSVAIAECDVDDTRVGGDGPLTNGSAAATDGDVSTTTNGDTVD